MPSDEQLNLTSPPEDWLVIRHYISKECLPDKLSEAQAFRALLQSISFYDKLDRRKLELQQDMEKAEAAVIDAQEAEKAAIDEGFESAEILSKEVENLTAELEEISQGHRLESEETVAGYETQLESLTSKFEVEKTDHSFLKRQYETLEAQYRTVLADKETRGGGGMFGGDSQSEDKLNSAHAELLKVNKTVHQLQAEQMKMKGDLIEMEKNLSKAQDDRSEAVGEADTIKESMAADLKAPRNRTHHHHSVPRLSGAVCCLSKLSFSLGVSCFGRIWRKWWATRWPKNEPSSIKWMEKKRS